MQGYDLSSDLKAINKYFRYIFPFRLGIKIPISTLKYKKKEKYLFLLILYVHFLIHHRITNGTIYVLLLEEKGN